MRGRSLARKAPTTGSAPRRSCLSGRCRGSSEAWHTTYRCRLARPRRRHRLGAMRVIGPTAPPPALPLLCPIRLADVMSIAAAFCPYLPAYDLRGPSPPLSACVLSFIGQKGPLA